MGDDILGHDHLDHGKHLHKGERHHHGPHRGTRPRRDARLPQHVGVLGKTRSEHQAKGHQHDDGHVKARIHWKIVLIIVALLVPVLIVFYQAATALAVAITILAIDVLIELHKWYTEGMPIDLEILSPGIAYMTAAYSIGWGLLLALLGPIVVGMSHQEFSEGTLVRAASYLAVAFAALALGPAPVALFAAVLVGLAVRAAGSALIVQRSLAVNIGGRLSTALLAAYLIFLVLPQV